MRKWVGFYNYTVILTYIGFCCGVAGILFAISNGNTIAAVICLLLAGLCDGFDGKIASTKKDRTPDEKRFGIQIDSLSDVVCFGVLPASIGVSLGLKCVWGYAIMIAFVLCGLIRLAYYNVTEETRQEKETGSRKFYVGLPITSSCIAFPVLWAIAFVLNIHEEVWFSYIYAALLAVMGFLFVCPVNVKKLGMKGILALVIAGLAVVAALVITLIIR